MLHKDFEVVYVSEIGIDEFAGDIPVCRIAVKRRDLIGIETCWIFRNHIFSQGRLEFDGAVVQKSKVMGYGVAEEDFVGFDFSLDSIGFPQIAGVDCLCLVLASEMGAGGIDVGLIPNKVWGR